MNIDEITKELNATKTPSECIRYCLKMIDAGMTYGANKDSKDNGFFCLGYLEGILINEGILKSCKQS